MATLPIQILPPNERNGLILKCYCSVTTNCSLLGTLVLKTNCLYLEVNFIYTDNIYIDTLCLCVYTYMYVGCLIPLQILLVLGNPLVWNKLCKYHIPLNSSYTHTNHAHIEAKEKAQKRSFTSPVWQYIYIFQSCTCTFNNQNNQTTWNCLPPPSPLTLLWQHSEKNFIHIMCFHSEIPPPDILTLKPFVWGGGVTHNATPAIFQHWTKIWACRAKNKRCRPQLLPIGDPPRRWRGNGKQTIPRPDRQLFIYLETPETNQKRVQWKSQQRLNM